MEETRQLLAALREINKREGSVVTRLTPSLIGMFGSIAMFDHFLADLDQALAARSVPDALKRRAANLSGTFIPQVAGFNSIENAASHPVTADELRAIHIGSPGERRQGVALILGALMKILDAILKID